MEPITEDQEWTLRRWVSTKGNGPLQKSDKAFLTLEKGLSEEQIDSWFENCKAPQNDVNVAMFAPEHGGPSNNIQPQGSGFLSLNTSGQNQNQSFLGDLQFGPLDMDLDFPSTSQEMHNWTPMGLSRDQDFSSTIPITFSDSQDMDAWSTVADSERGLLASSAASIAESCPVLSPSSDHRRHTHGTQRSSYGSSIRTWDTASTLYDPNADDLMLDDPEMEASQTVNPMRLTRNSNFPVSRFSACKSIPEEESSCHRSEPGHMSSQELMPSQRRLTGPPVPPKPSKPPGLYICTVPDCLRPFNRKGDWKRHEESHDPQTYWICMLGDPAVQTSIGWVCVFCNAFKPNRNEITLHLVKNHKINECTNKVHENRKWGRKDKLKQHLQQVHKLEEGAVGWEPWQREARKKWAFGCGFCGGCFSTWEERLNHIAEHYEKQNVNNRRWSSSLVVTGLLKQVHQDFNVLGAWNALAGVAPIDGLLHWSREDASNLRRKLEYHEATPEALAREAFSLGSKHLERKPLVWTNADSRVATLTAPVDFSELEKETWRSNDIGAMSHRARLSAPLPAVPSNFEIPGDASNFI
ncbi:hypothetical protein G7Y89_g1153 [Cudoniella acicularis]|uniref:C2H2-type domain-containing protein n=1 Tax=Cudoniella acicularis TaxID=354080 RepID=A0A8H4RYP0_9HELO|nr:hypothetical protein G7Y89_g1153 [Cudoniella acicularis]